VNDPSPEPAPHALLRRWYRGCYAAGELVHPVRYVLDERGLPVSALPRAALGHPDATLFVPEESGESLQLHVRPEVIDPDADPAADRYLIYHGRPEGVAWARLTLMGARLGGRVFSPEDAATPNPWSAIEPALCRRVNADVAILMQAVRTNDPGAKAVGVDPWGMDVRLRWEVVRVAWPEPPDPAPAEVAAAIVEQQLRRLTPPNP